MAYNRTFNPDALPAFAEPERKHSSPPATTTTTSPPPPTTSYPPRQSSAGSHHSPPPAPSYQNKPPPPLPGQDRLRSDSYGRHPSLGMQQQPPGNYSYSTTPPGNHNGRFPPDQQRPPIASATAASRPPPTPAPPQSDPSLLPLFRAVDKDGSGQLSEHELGAALVNGDWTSFDPLTVRLMIRMFDTDRSGTIGFEEFCGLWSFLASWRTLFDRFDADRSGNISIDEYTNALVAFGYRLSPEFVRYLFSTYDKTGSHSLSFDLFVQSCISLKRMTDSFKRYDDDRDGFVTLSFEEFLTEILRQR